VKEEGRLDKKKELVAVIDFGSQYTQLIARKVRENNVYAEVVSHRIPADKLSELNPLAIILSGGPASVYQNQAPDLDPAILDMEVPILGICYGMQLIAKHSGGHVKGAECREYGRSQLTVDDNADLFKDVPQNFVVWMSHGDRVEKLPDGFTALAKTPDCPYAAVRHKNGRLFGLQLHPEVHHTEHGSQILRNFLYEVCGASGSWRMSSYVNETIADIRSKVGSEHVILGLSGGVDSSVAAVLLQRAIGKQLSCIFVDNGLLRKGERESVVETFDKHFDIDLHVADAGARFLADLKGVADPEKKRKAIGAAFIDVFKEEAKKITDVKFLAQGTLYPDVIESTSAFGGPTSVIKSHHNVGGLPEELGFELVEPLRMLFKDEVRRVAEEIGLPRELVVRHPFPGPGLAVRIIGDVTKERLDLLRECDAIFIEEITRAGLYEDIWQGFCVLLPVQSVGVMGDERTYEFVVAVRAVDSVDGMTADWFRMPHEILDRISSRIISEVRGVNRVVYDVSSKPPSTIEWE
jgi:GMP synthase (glutamine-hydrolysing)